MPDQPFLCIALLFGGRPCARPALDGTEDWPLCGRCQDAKDEVQQRWGGRPELREEAKRIFDSGEGRPKPLSREELQAASEKSSRYTGANPVAKPPEDNVYGKLKVYERTDGFFVVYDPDQAVSAEVPVYRSELDARLAALGRA
jgi:hypothetical protein